MKKKLLIGILGGVCTVACAAALSACAGGDPNAEGRLTYRLNAEETSYTVTGYTGKLTADVAIPETYEGKPVTAVDARAFAWCADVETITIPASVESLGVGAFRSCANLSGVTFASGSVLRDIGERAFEDCDKLTEIAIPTAVVDIEGYAFYDCDGLGDVAIPTSVATLGNWAFYHCDNLASVTFGDNALIEAIEDRTFSDCASLESVNFGANSRLSSIGDAAFYKCTALTDVTVPNTVERIDDYAFFYCNQMTGVNFSASVALEVIGDYAFWGCAELANFQLPNSVATIGEKAFDACENLPLTVENVCKYLGVGGNAYYWLIEVNADGAQSEATINAACTKYAVDAFDDEDLKSIVVADGSGVYASDGGILYDNNKTVLYVVPAAIEGAVVLPDSLTEVPSDAFKGTAITSVSIGGGVTQIGKSAFFKCEQLTEVNVVSTGADLTIGYSAFYGCDGLTKVSLPERVSELEYCAFRNCKNLVNVEIDGIETLGSQVFAECANLESLSLAGVQVIGDNAFSECGSLTDVLIPVSVSQMDSGIFNGCNSLTVYCEATANQSGWASDWANKTDKEKLPVVYDCNNNDVANDGCVYIYEDGVRYALKGGVAKVVCQPSKMTSSDIADSVSYKGTVYNVTAIEKEAYVFCTGLTSVKMGKNVSTVGEKAFKGLTELTDVTTSAALVSIKKEAFYECSKLRSVSLPATLREIGGSAFGRCANLTAVNFEEGAELQSIGGNAFNGCAKLTSFVITADVSKIGQGVFNGCTTLTNVTFQDTTTWYCTTVADDWDIAENGTETDVTNVNLATLNENYWYKK